MVFDGRQHAAAVAVRGIDGDTSTLRATSSCGALQEIAGSADGRAHAQPPLAVLGRIGILQLLLDVLYGDQSLEDELVVHHQQFFHAVFVQDGFRLLERGAHRHGDQVLLGHHFGNGRVEAVLEAQIAIGENADQLAVLGYRHAGDPVAGHQLLRGGDGQVRADGDGVHDHAALTAFHAVHFFGLPRDGHVAVDDSDAALLRQRDGQVRFRHGIHGGRDDGDVQRDLARQTGAGVGFRRQHIAAGRLEQNVVESEAFGEYVLNHRDFYHDSVEWACGRVRPFETGWSMARRWRPEVARMGAARAGASLGARLRAAARSWRCRDCGAWLYRNLSLALPELGAARHREIVDGVFRSIARVLVAFAKFPAIRRET